MTSESRNQSFDVVLSGNKDLLFKSGSVKLIIESPQSILDLIGLYLTINKTI